MVLPQLRYAINVALAACSTDRKLELLTTLHSICSNPNLPFTEQDITRALKLLIIISAINRRFSWASRYCPNSLSAVADAIQYAPSLKALLHFKTTDLVTPRRLKQHEAWQQCLQDYHDFSREQFYVRLEQALMEFSYSLQRQAHRKQMLAYKQSITCIQRRWRTHLQSKLTLWQQNNLPVIIYSHCCFFKMALRKFFMRKHIPHKAIHTSDVWVRDYLIPTQKAGKPQLYIRNKHPNHHVFIPEEQQKSVQFFNSKLPEGAQAGSPQGPWKSDYTILYPKMAPPKDRHLNPLQLKASYPTHSTKRPLEGGNLFIATNVRHETYYIIGEQVILFEELAAILKNKPPPQRDDIINRYKRLFNTEHILVIPNLTYHLDLQMAYIGQGIFLIHSFTETQRHFPNEHATYAKPYQRDFGKDIFKHKEATVNDIITTLQQHGFQALPCCGALYHHDAHLWLGTGFRSLFINGIHCYSPTEKQHYFITLDSIHLGHKRYFTALLQQFNIKVHYLTADLHAAWGTLRKVSRHHGALRCQTNSISIHHMHYFPNLVDRHDTITPSTGIGETKA